MTAPGQVKDEFRPSSLGFWVWGVEFKVQGSGFRVQGVRVLPVLPDLAAAVLLGVAEHRYHLQRIQARSRLSEFEVRSRNQTKQEPLLACELGASKVRLGLYRGCIGDILG